MWLRNAISRVCGKDQARGVCAFGSATERYCSAPILAGFAATRCRSALCAGSSQRGHALGHGFELANGLAAKEKRDGGADRDNHENRAEEDRRRSDMRHHQKRRQHAGEEPPGRLAEGLPYKFESTSLQRRVSGELGSSSKSTSRVERKWDQQFESGFLQQRVSCEPEAGTVMVGNFCFRPQSRPL